jgi:hypothetical protein
MLLLLLLLSVHMLLLLLLSVHMLLLLLLLLLSVPPLQDAIDACNGWEIDRQVDQAMDSLR